MANAFNPLPSLIRASAFDAANMRMNGEGRKKWNDEDWNAMCETQERLVTACYGRDGDNDPNLKYYRFQIAGQLEKQGDFNLQSDCNKVMAFIDAYVLGDVAEAA